MLTGSNAAFQPYHGGCGAITCVIWKRTVASSGSKSWFGGMTGGCRGVCALEAAALKTAALHLDLNQGLASD
jgi:hypothetical protein